MKRENAINVIKKLPRHFKMEELFERLVLIESIEQGLTQLRKKKTIPQSTIKTTIKSW